MRLQHVKTIPGVTGQVAGLGFQVRRDHGKMAPADKKRKTSTIAYTISFLLGSYAARHPYTAYICITPNIAALSTNYSLLCFLTPP
jgi:hypothetical protein